MNLKNVEFAFHKELGRRITEDILEASQVGDFCSNLRKMCGSELSAAENGGRDSFKRL